MGSFYLGFDGNFHLGDLLLIDPQGDTLLSLESLQIALHKKPLWKGDIAIQKIQLQGLKAKIFIDKGGGANYDFLMALMGDGEEESSEGGGVQIPPIDYIGLCEVILDYTDLALGQEIYGHLGCFELEPGIWDWAHMDFDLGNWRLSQTQLRWILYGQEEFEPQEEQAIPGFCLSWAQASIEDFSLSYRDLAQGEEWEVQLGELSNSHLSWDGWKEALQAGGSAFDDLSLVHKDGGQRLPQAYKWDYGNLGIYALSGVLEEVYFAKDSLSLRCKDFGFKERCGWELTQLKGDLFLGKSHLELQNLFFSTQHSGGFVDLAGDFPDWGSMGSYQAHWKGVLDKIFLSPEDARHFMDDFLPQGWHRGPLELQGSFETLGNQLDIRRLGVQQRGWWSLSASGNLRDYLSEQPSWVMRLEKGAVYRPALLFGIEDVDSLLHKEVLQKGLQLKGRSVGNASHGEGQWKVQLGSLQWEGALAWREGNQWEGAMHLRGEALDQVLKMDLTHMDASLHTQGYYKGEEDYAYSAQFQLDTLQALGYALSGVSAWLSADTDRASYGLDLSLEHFGCAVEGKLSLDDQWQWEADIGLGGSLHEYLSGDWPYLVHMSEWNVKGSWDPGISLAFDLVAKNDLRWGVEEGFVFTPPGYLSYYGGKDISSFSSRLSFLEVDFGGNMSFEVLMDFARREASAFWPDWVYQTPDSILDDGLVECYVRFHPEEVLQSYFLGDWDFSDTLWLEFMADGRTRNAFFHAQAKHLGSGSLSLSEPKVWIDWQEGSFSYGTSFRQIQWSDFVFYDFLVSGWIRENRLVSELELRNKQGLLSHFVGFTIAPKGNGFTLHLHPELFMIDNAIWQMSENNLLQWADRYLAIEDFNLYNEETHIALFTDPVQGHDNLTLSIRGLDMGRLARAYASEEFQLEGILAVGLRGECIFDQSQWYLTGDWAKAKLSQYDLGDIHWCADYEEGVVKTLFRLDGDNELFALGTILWEQGELEQDIEVSRLNADLLEWLAPDQVENAQGYLRGRLALGYSASSGLSLRGGLQFREVSLFSKFLGVTLSLQEEKIRFDERGIVLESFVLRDDKGRPFALEGSIETQDYSSFAYAVDLKAQSFTLLNTEENKRDIFSGRFVFSADLNIRGSNELPKITGEIRVEESTKVSVVMPEQAADIIERESIVVFVDSVSMALKQQAMEGRDTLVRTTSLEGMELRLRLRSEEKAVVSLYIDPIAGDYLVISGKSLLNVGINKRGELSLHGRFEVTEGYYQLSMFDIVKKRFSLVAGSQLTWAGDPYAVDLGITARYEVRASPLDLVSDRMVGLSPDQMNAYRQDLPFWVDLLIKGSLNAPDISFHLDMPENRKGALDGVVYARLQELNQVENEVNKQAFGLIVFNRFLSGWTPGGEGGGEAMARSSASRIISQQMNHMADRLVKGIDLNFQLDSYGTAGEGLAGGRTQLNVEVQKRFLEDRLIFQVGSNIGIEGRPEAQSASTSDWVGDIVAEYLVTPDGRYRLKAFRKNQFEGLVDGQVINTGVSFVFVRQQDTRDIRERKKLLGLRTEEKEPVIMKSGNEE
jgi:translocation and assembly module TamB